MEFLKYDQDFQKEVVEAYREFGLTRPKPRGRAPPASAGAGAGASAGAGVDVSAGVGDVRKPSSPKNGVRERAASSMEPESEEDQRLNS